MTVPNRCRDGHDIEIAVRNAVGTGRIRQMPCLSQFFARTFECRVGTALEFGHALFTDIETDGRVLLAKFHGQRQADITKTNDADAEFTDIE